MNTKSIFFNKFSLERDFYVHRVLLVQKSILFLLFYDGEWKKPSCVNDTKSKTNHFMYQSKSINKLYKNVDFEFPSRFLIRFGGLWFRFFYISFFSHWTWSKSNFQLRASVNLTISLQNYLETDFTLMRNIYARLPSFRVRFLRLLFTGKRIFFIWFCPFVHGGKSIRKVLDVARLWCEGIDYQGRGRRFLVFF